MKNIKTIRNKIYNKLLKSNIDVRPIFNPLHLMPPFFNKKTKLNQCEDISKRGLSLPIFPNLKQSEVYKITKIVKNNI